MGDERKWWHRRNERELRGARMESWEKKHIRKRRKGQEIGTHSTAVRGDVRDDVRVRQQLSTGCRKTDTELAVWARPWEHFQPSALSPG